MDLVKEISPGTQDEINVIIEIPKGKRNKYEYDKEHKIFALDRVVPESLVYAADYGFIPQTHCDDGDPLDAYVIMREPTYPGILIKARPVGMLQMIDGGEEDNKLICVPVDDMYFNDITQIKQLPKHLLAEIKYFLEHYKDLQNKTVEVKEFLDAAAAKKEFKTACELYKKQQ